MLCKLLASRLLLSLLAVVLQAPPALSAANVLFVLLDTTRADRFTAWGNPRATTPALDALGRSGVVFRHHFANAHATRSSMPQLMTGRYYHRDILRPFMPNAHPREFPFNRPDPTAVLLPATLHGHGYQTLGVSSHPWVTSNSPFGEHFERLEFIAGDPTRGYADATAVVDHAIALWKARDTERPVFLYVHLMDLHMPRHLPDSAPRFVVNGFDWRRRFDAGSRPLFDPERRRWSEVDARDFTAVDRDHFVAVYDTRLAHADAQVERLLDAVRSDDPMLHRTLIVVVADHGEELAEESRTSHGDALADGVQHIPWIMAGAGVQPGQSTARFTENVDVLPTLLAVLDLQRFPETHTDGRPQLDADGRLRLRAGRPATYYAWEHYRGIRTERHLLRQPTPASFEERCRGGELLYVLEGDRRVRLDPGGSAAPIAARLRDRLARRLDARERLFLERRYARPIVPFLFRPQFWRVGDAARFTCLQVDGNTGRDALDRPGWLWSGRGVAILVRDGDDSLPVSLLAPDGEYRVEAAVVPIDEMPWLSGFERWRRRSVLDETPREHVPLGTFRASGGRLALAIPAAAAFRKHVVGLRLSPPDAVPAAGALDDRELRERLKALGYVH
jgi:arylsulfatase A-like enzyme